MPTRGIVTIAYGPKATAELHQMLQQTFAFQMPLPSITVIGDVDHSEEHVTISGRVYPQPGRLSWKAARAAKISLYDLSPYDHTLYIDADTRIQGDISPGFRLLDAGYELVIVPSHSQGNDLLWHVDAAEREQTFLECGYSPLQLQAGVFWFRKTAAVKRLFANWRKEWLRYEGQDQAAFTRALHTSGVKLWLMGRPFNGGPVIQHHFGACR
jgi:hypothetical protein